MDPNRQFKRERENRIEAQGKNIPLIKAANTFREESIKSKYSYNFSWMGRPIIQYPQDIVVMQEILWRVKPDLLIETGIAHGGSIIFYASILELIGKGDVLGIDIEIRPHNRKAIEKHPMARRITMIEGDSISSAVLDQVQDVVRGKETVLVCLDSNHTGDHVLNEMKLYSQFVTRGSYLIVFDTIIEELPNEFYSGRPWSKNNNPKTAVREFLKTNHRFAIDKSIETKLLITVAPDGYLKCTKE
jgi:cephalosporin hydroxylase